MKECCCINFHKTGLIMKLITLFNIECNIYKQVIKYYSNLFYCVSCKLIPGEVTIWNMPLTWVLVIIC